MPDMETSLLATPLSPYRCEPYVDGRPLAHRIWSPGQLQFMVAGVEPRAILDSDWRMLHVYMPQAMLRQAADEIGLATGLELCDPAGEGDALFHGLLTAVAHEIADHGQPSLLAIDGIGAAMAVHLVRRWTNRASPRSLPRGGLAGWKMRRVIACLDAHLADDVPLVVLAALVNLSPFHFCRAFRDAMGVPPHRYQMLQRIERAKQLLVATAEPIVAVAAAVGYADASHFTGLFRRHVGVTPSRYRRVRLS
jgi:AraC family transcriptional regulator